MTDRHVEQAKRDISARPTVYGRLIRGSGAVQAEVTGYAEGLAEALGIPAIGSGFTALQAAIAAGIQLGWALHEAHEGELGEAGEGNV